MEIYVAFSSELDTRFSLAAFSKLEMRQGGSSENPIVLDEEEEKEKSPLTIPVSECPTEPSRLLTSRLFGKRIENVPEYVYRILVERKL